VEFLWHASHWRRRLVAGPLLVLTLGACGGTAAPRDSRTTEATTSMSASLASAGRGGAVVLLGGRCESGRVVVEEPRRSFAASLCVRVGGHLVVDLTLGFPWAGTASTNNRDVLRETFNGKAGEYLQSDFDVVRPGIATVVAYLDPCSTLPTVRFGGTSGAI
jgi:hypothetical protein